MVLTEMRRSAEKALGHSVSKAVITVPAHFNDQQRQATKDAGRIAGLEVLRIINEPTAAALAYGLQEKRMDGSAGQEATNVIIFDLGGGTFDVSVLSMEGGVFEVKATGGDTHLGGEDFDNILVDWALDQIGSEFGATTASKVRKSGRASRRLRAACEAAKRVLSSSSSATVEVEGLAEDIDVSLTLTREAFDGLNQPLFDRCMNTVKAVLKDARLALDDVSDCVLVGGSTRVLALQDALRDLFQGRLDLCKSINPDEAVAVGAAVQGRILATGGFGGGTDLIPGTSTDLLLLDVTPLSLGIELEGKQMSTLIKRNTPIPCRKSRTYTTVADWQTDIDVVVYEGERPHIDANNKLGEFQISGVERAKAGVPQVEVTFALDANGILNVSAQDKVTNAFAKAEIKAERGRLTEDEIDRMVYEAERYRRQDEELASKVALRNAIEEALYRALAAARDRSDEDAIVQLEDVRDWLELDSDDASLEDVRRRAVLLNESHGASIEVPSGEGDEGAAAAGAAPAGAAGGGR